DFAAVRNTGRRRSWVKPVRLGLSQDFRFAPKPGHLRVHQLSCRPPMPAAASPPSMRTRPTTRSPVGYSIFVAGNSAPASRTRRQPKRTCARPKDQCVVAENVGTAVESAGQGLAASFAFLAP